MIGESQNVPPHVPQDPSVDRRDTPYESTSQPPAATPPAQHDAHEPGREETIREEAEAELAAAAPVVEELGTDVPPEATTPAYAEPTTAPAGDQEPSPAPVTPAAPGAGAPEQTEDAGPAEPRTPQPPSGDGDAQDRLPVDIDGGHDGPTGRPLPQFPEPAPLHGHGPARVIAMCNQKGGVGKTTTTISLGAALAEYGRKVLLVDFDPQGALSVGLGIPTNRLDVTIYNLLTERGHDIREVIQQTRTDGLDVVPANIDLSAAEVQLVGEVAREQILSRVLRPVMDDYDVILIDCQPSLGLLTVNALTAAHGVIIPLETEFFAMRGVALLVETIEKIQDRLNPRLQVDGILPTMYDSRTLHSREVVRSVVDHFGEQVFHTVISRTVKFPDATLAAEPITSYASTHSGANAYRQLARELVARGGAA